MSTDPLPSDLIDLSRAAKLAERSERTIRRWASPKAGKLRRFEGTPPVAGGPAPVLVSERELMTLLAASGQKPRVSEADTPDMSSDNSSSDMPASSPDTDQTVMLLRQRLAAAELRTELAKVTAERDTLLGQVDDLRGQVEADRRRWELERSDHRADLESERDRSRALAAELMALRKAQAQGGVPWWRKLLGGAVEVPALPEAK